MDKWIQRGLGMIMAWLTEVLLGTINKTWDDVWEKLFELVAEAEQKWKESGMGEQKRQWVIDHIMTWLNEQTEMNGLVKIAVKFLIGKLVDALVAELNNALGKDWVKKAREFEDYLAEMIPLIEDGGSVNNNI